MKYLGAKLSQDLSQLKSINYDPLISGIKSDIARWNLIPFTSLVSRVEAIKMNVPPRLLYIFQTQPVEITDRYFREWDRFISRYIWQGKRPRIRFRTLQLPCDGCCMIFYYTNTTEISGYEMLETMWRK